MTYNDLNFPWNRENIFWLHFKFSSITIKIQPFDSRTILVINWICSCQNSAFTEKIEMNLAANAGLSIKEVTIKSKTILTGF